MLFLNKTLVFCLATVVFFDPSLANAGGVKKFKAAKPVQLQRRFIIRYKEKVSGQRHALAVSRRQGIKIFRKGYARHQFKDLEKSLQDDDPSIDWIAPDLLLQAQWEPGDGATQMDPLYRQQWHYFASFGISLPQAWDLTTGDSGIVVAVVDTGVLPHKDLQNKLLPGYDFISDGHMANDGDGRDGDAHDPGDWIGWGECEQRSRQDSSWHGTHVAGTIGASSGNGQGVAGVSWASKILPVRVLGKCGGYTSDIADGVKWAAGVAVPGVPHNPHPAKVINLSLGGVGSCGAAMQGAINQALNRGAVVVVAAGNANADLDFNDYTPANCSGVIVVAATNRLGERASYSNFGARVDVAAPGGDAFDQVLSLSNSGATGPAQDTYKGYRGTSMATPHVAGVAALIFALVPNLNPQQVKEIILQGADSFGHSSDCTTETCGAGLLNAFQALLLAQKTSPVAATPLPVNAPPRENYTAIAKIRDDEGGGGCGSIDVHGDGPGQGPSLLLGFFLIGLCAKLGKKAKTF